MADSDKVKLFKQYLIDTKAFQTLAEILSLVCVIDNLNLQNADPKPENPIQFIRKRLSNPIDGEEFRCMKQSLSKLNEDMGQMKADVTKISNIMSKLLPNQQLDVNSSVDVSVQSMENNVGNNSRHISMLDDSSLIFDQTATDDNDLNSTMHSVDEPQLNCSDTDAVNLSQSKDSSKDSAHGFTLEFIEVDVVNKSSLDLSMVSQDEKANEELTMTSTPETTAITEPVTDTQLADTNVNIDELPIVFKEENPEELLTFSQGFHGFDIHDMQESKTHLMSAETVDQSKLDVSNYETNNQTNSASNAYDEPKTGQIELQEPFVAKMSEDENINASHDGPIEASIESKAFTESDVVPISTEFVSVGEIVEGIMNKVEVSMNIGGSENEVDPIVGAVDGSPNIETKEVIEAGDGYAKAVVVTVMPKDDPETKLFLSHS